MSAEIVDSEVVGETLSIKFNQDYTSLAVVGKTGYRLFCMASVNQVDEIFNSNNEDIKIAERLFSSSLVAVVTAKESTMLKVCHFKKGTEICNYNYPFEIRSVRLNRSRMVITLDNSLYVHNVRDMKMLHAIHHNAGNKEGLSALSLNSYLAYPTSSKHGELQIFECIDPKPLLRIQAHESPLAALCFSANGLLLATASEKGTVIRVFCVKNGQRVHEFRRGVKRYVRIASLNFSSCAQYLSVSSNTETVHVFRIDPQAVETAERLACIPLAKADGDENDSTTTKDDSSVVPSEESRWTMGYITKAMTSYFPTQVSDVLSQDRAFATVQLSQAGLRHECVITKLEKETRLVVACEDGFLYMYSFDDVRGGDCKLLGVHDLRNALCGVTELNLDTPSVPGNTDLDLLPESYARMVRGSEDAQHKSDTETMRDLNEAINPPQNIFDALHFPPVTATAGVPIRCAAD